VLEAKDIAKEIVRRVERGDGGVIRMPFYAKCVPMLSVMPGGVQMLVRWWSGIDRAIVDRPAKASKVLNSHGKVDLDIVHKG